MNGRGLVWTRKEEVAAAVAAALGIPRAELLAVEDERAFAAALTAHDTTIAFVDLADDPGPVLAAVERARGAAAPVLALARDGRAEWVLRALRAGARDFIVVPGEVEDLRAAVARALRSEAAPRARTFAVYAPSGGAGASSLALALAERLHAHGAARVLLLDLNLALGHAAAALAHPCEYGPLDLLDDLERLDEDLLFSRLTRHPTGFYVASLGEETEDAETVAPAAVGRLVHALAPHFDAVVLDVPHDLAPRTRAALTAADVVFFLAADSVPSLKRAQATLRGFGDGERGAERFRIVRRSGFGRELSDADLASALGRPVSAYWPDDRAALAAAARAGLPVSIAAPRSQAARAADALAAHATGRATSAPARGFARIFGRSRRSER